MPRRPARPVSCVYSPGVRSAWFSPFHLSSRSMTTVLAGMLMPSASVSVANTRLDQAGREQLLHDLLERRQHARVVRGDPALQPGEPVGVAEDGQVLVGMSAVRRLRPASVISAASCGVVSRRPAFRHCSTAASQPARLKMNVIAGSRPAASSRSITSGRLGGPEPGRPPRRRAARGPAPCARAAPPACPILVTRWASRTQLRVDLAGRRGPRRSRRAAAVGPGEQVVQPGADQHVLPQRHRPVLVDDDRGAAADLRQPVAELLGVADRRRQRDQLHRLGQVDDHLFPDRAAERSAR